MNIKLKKIINDLCSYPGRSLLVIAALVIGLWGIGSILVSYAILKNDLTDNFTQTKPLHVAVVSEDFDRLDLQEFRHRPEIESAEFRDLSFERIEVYPNVWLPLFLYGVEDFTHFNLAKFYHQAGDRVPSQGTLLIERNGQNITQLEVGSVARLQTSAAQILEVPIAGLSFDPAQTPSTMDHLIYGYVDKQTYTHITGKPTNRRLIFRLNNVTTKQDVQTKTQSLLDDFKTIGIRIKKINLSEVDEHPHQFQLNSLLFLQGGIGLYYDWNFGPKLIVSLTTSTSWMNTEYAQAYYSVNYDTDHLNTYQASAGFKDVSTIATVSYQLNKVLGVMLISTASYLLNDAAQSPISEKDLQASLATAIFYQF